MIARLPSYIKKPATALPQVCLRQGWLPMPLPPPGPGTETSLLARNGRGHYTSHGSPAAAGPGP